MTKELVFDALNGRKYKVRVVNQGEHYGLNNVLTHEDETPMIGFNLVRKGNSDYFVSRYYMDTFLGIHHNDGLCLVSGQRDLDLNKFDLAFIRAWLHADVLN